MQCYVFFFVCFVCFLVSLVLVLSYLLWASGSPKTRQAECTKRLFKPFWTLVAQEGNLRLTKCSTKLLSGGGSGIGNFSSHWSTLVCKVVWSKEFCKISMRMSTSSSRRPASLWHGRSMEVNNLKIVRFFKQEFKPISENKLCSNSGKNPFPDGS